MLIRSLALLCLLIPGLFAAVDKGLAAGIPVMVFEGDGQQRGKDMAQVNGGMLTLLLAAVRHDGWFTADEKRIETLKKEIDPDHLAQIEHLAKGSGLKPNDVLSTCLAIDTLCSAVVREAEVGEDGKANKRPLRMARSLEFPMAELLAPTTQLTVERPKGRHAFVSIGWPGYVPVVSGMNEHGLVACILLNEGSLLAGSESTGAPVAFRVREILERATTVKEAIAVFGRNALMTSHYVALADPQTAAVVWWDMKKGAAQARYAKDGWLTCTNAKPQNQAKGRDRRTRVLNTLLENGLGSEVDDLILALKEVELKGLNAQAMIFEPETRRLMLSLATPSGPAVAGPYRDMDFSGILAGKSVKEAPPVKP